MGAWGTDIFDNDVAADLALEWEREIKKSTPIELGRRLRQPEANGYNRFPDVVMLYALADLQLQEGEIDPDLAAECIGHIDAETDLQSWNEPQERQQHLLRLRERIASKLEEDAIWRDSVERQHRPLPESAIEILY